MFTSDPRFWRAGALSSTIVMIVVLIVLSVDTLRALEPGSPRVPAYTVINQKITYEYDADRRAYEPKIGATELLFGRVYDDRAAEAAITKGKLVFQSRACMNCHTVFGTGAYYAPDLTKAWLDPVWQRMWIPMTRSHSTDEAMAAFLMHPDRYPTWTRQMPNLHLDRTEAEATVAYIKWLSSVDTNGFPSRFGHAEEGP